MLYKMRYALPIAFVALCATDAHASHNAWVLKDPGSACQRSSYDALYVTGRSIGVTHQSTDTRTYICPVTLAGIWASNGTTYYPQNLTARSGYSVVMLHDNDGSADASCSLQVQLTTGAILYSQTKYSSGTGYQKLWIKGYGSGTTWGNSLGSGNVYIRAMNYYCNMPKNIRILQTVTNICLGPNGCYNAFPPSLP